MGSNLVLTSRGKRLEGVLRGMFGPTPPWLERSLNWALWGGIIPAVAAGAIIFGAIALPSALSAAHGRGVRGTMVVQQRAYHESLRTGRHCTGSMGTFTSADGGVHFDDALLDGVCSVPIGKHIPVFYEGHRPVVYAQESNEWILISSLMVICGGYLIVWGVVVSSKLRERRRRGRLR